MATPAFSENSGALLGKMREIIKDQGAIRFRDYMRMALYDPEYGYYTASSQRVGKEGDFITSVSVGRCFGLILAQRLIAYWEELLRDGRSFEAFHIIEPGAHDGALCADILSEIQSASPELFKVVHYHLIETTPTLIEAQCARLDKDFSEKYTSHATLAELHGLTGAILSNELVDAFPVDLIKFENGQWWQLLVEDSEDGLRFTNANVDRDDPELIEFCESLGVDFPDGYTTEFNPGISGFAKDSASALSTGLMITVDYGHRSEDYYHPDRTTGTLQTYHQHQKSDNPLLFPGEIDITSHVNFSKLMSEAETQGFVDPQLKTQASYLTNHARNWLISLETSPTKESPALMRQFQTLTHPAMLGTKFMVLEMKKDTL